MTEAALEIRGVSKSYAEHVAVSDFSLSVPRGTVYGLLGPNGAGKTTTIRMILDIIAPDSGSITILGRPHGDRGILNSVGYLPEERGLYKKMSVRDVLRFLAELKGVDGDKVYVLMGGGCQGCAVSAMTLREGIAASITGAIPEITEVIDVTDHDAGENPYYR